MTFQLAHFRGENPMDNSDATRRDFIKTVGATIVSTGLVNCSSAEEAKGNSDPPLTHLSATKLSQLIAKREVSAEEVATAYLGRRME